MLGILFVGLCVLAIVLNLLLPRRSSAASNTIVLNPDADAYVTQSSPTKASPTSSQLLAIGGSSARQSFLRFTVGGIPAGTDVQSARLRMVVINDSTSGGIISAISNTTWAEDITWNTRPAVDGPQLVQLGPVALNQVVEVDVTAAIKGNGAYSFALTAAPANLNTVGYASRQNSVAANRPQLIVTLPSGTSTQPTATTAPGGPTATPIVPTATPAVPTATAVPPGTANQGPCARPYSDASPWNTKIAANPTYDPQSDYHITALSGSLGSDPTQYAFPVYEVTSSTPLRTVKLSGAFSNVVDNDTRVIWQSGGTVQVPIPAGAQQSAGSDGNIIILNRQTGDEWGFFQASANSDGSWNAKNSYHYNTNWDGVPPTNSSTFVSRGAGVPYLVGLIRPCEIAQGHIDHALAFAYDYPTSQFVYPATRSDGGGSGPDMPEGTRLQLDPSLSDTQLKAKGCSGNCLVIAHALQQYGMIIIDKAGHPKIMPEYEGTAHWNGAIAASTASNIPLSSFKVLK